MNDSEIRAFGLLHHGCLADGARTPRARRVDKDGHLGEAIDLTTSTTP